MNDRTILPILKPFDWAGRDQVVCRPMLGETVSMAPIIAYGNDRQSAIEFLMREGQDILPELESTALRNLCTRQEIPAWQRQSVPWESGSCDLLWRQGDELTASDILDTKFLKRTQIELNASILLLSIPTQQFMFATAETGKAPLGHITRKRYVEGPGLEETQLSSGYFVIKDGTIYAFIEVSS